MGFKIGKIAQTAFGGVSGLLDSGDSGLSDAAAGMVSGAVGVGMDLLTNRNNLKQQQALQDDAFSKNLQMWNLNNAYNDPAAQMERLEAAGLNKNLVYGGGNVTGNTSGSTPTYTAPDYSPVDKSVQRAQLGLALQEHQQRITNQAIENELARERIGLATREADREDRLADAQIKAYAANLGLTSANIGRIYDDMHYNDKHRYDTEQQYLDKIYVDALRVRREEVNSEYRERKQSNRYLRYSDVDSKYPMPIREKARPIVGWSRRK